MMKRFSISAKIGANWKSGLTVALVSIPLAVSLAVASHTSPEVGILTAIWAGLMASLFGGSNYNVVGPTGALSGLLAFQAIAHGAQCLPILAMLSGIWIIVAFVLRLDRYLVFIPGSVLHGFILGVAAIIILNQINFACGLTVSAQHESLMRNVIESLQHLGETSILTVGFFGIALAVLFMFARFLPTMPGAIVLAPVGIGVGYLCSINWLPFSLQTLGMKFPSIEPVFFRLPAFHISHAFLVPSFTIAVVAILETMISAKIADGVTRTKHDKGREMLGLGIANVVTGLCGGIPATAALARTSLNIKTGCNDKASATISSICIGLISFLLLGYFKYIPLAVVSAILVFTSIKMVEAEHLVHMFRLDKRGFIIAMVVAAVTVCEDPIIGILLGTAVTMVMFMEKVSQGHYELITPQPVSLQGEVAVKPHPEILIYSIKGYLAYINAQSHIAFFEQDLKNYHTVVLKLRDLYFIDLDGAQALSEIIEAIHAQGKTVAITGINARVAGILYEDQNIIQLKTDGLIFKEAAEALRFLDA
ncbi:MAG: SulP family inorganic anion transporter [Candidatus Babeliales bacterium]|jgi:SulP family sulfate permease